LSFARSLKARGAKQMQKWQSASTKEGVIFLIYFLAFEKKSLFPVE
jgi:hypothetical protein